MRTFVELQGPVVQSPIEDVFTFIGDLENSPKWGRTKRTVRDPEGSETIGARFREETKIFGEKVAHHSEVTGLEPPTRLSYSSLFENGVTEQTRITLETVEEGTRVDFAVEVEIEHLPQVLAPFVSLYIKQRLGVRSGKLENEFAAPDRSIGGAVLMVAIGLVLLATAGLGYLFEVFGEGDWSTVLALLSASLICAGLAAIVWWASRKFEQAETVEPGPGEEVATGDL